MCLRCTFVGRLVTSPYVYDEFVKCHDLTQCPLRRSSSSVVNDNGPPEVVRQRLLSTNVHFRTNLANAANWNEASADDEVDQWQTTTTARTGNEWAEPSSSTAKPEVTKRKRCRSSAHDLLDYDELSADHTRRLLIPGHTRPIADVKDPKDPRTPGMARPDGDDGNDGATRGLARGVPVKKQTRFLLAEYGLDSDARDTPV